mgnify:CR=1 FL=1
MNEFDDKQIDKASSAYLQLLGQDKWTSWTPVFGALTVVGATSYLGRYKVVGKQVFFQVKFSAATSIASVAGTDYLNLPITATGYGGQAAMTNTTTNIAVGTGHIDSATSRAYLPSQIASANIFILAGWYEIG